MQKVANLKLEDMIRFSRLLLEFQDVIRAVRLPRGDVKENDVEHSYHLAMMAWYLNDVGDLGYDTSRIIRYALLHDLAEAYAGDVHALDLEGRKGKDKREAAALDRILTEFPGAAPMITTIEQYETKSDPEAVFVYALDKIMPMLMIYIEGGRTWRDEGLTWEQLHDNKHDKVALSEPVQELYEQLRLVLEKQPELFGTKT